LYIIGGTANVNRFGKVYAFDLDSHAWSSLELEAVKERRK
jgi:hypothetical protein